MVTQEQIKNLANEIAESYQPKKIYLFGSYAIGVPNDDSDIDLFIVKETDKRWIDRRVEVRSSIKNYINSMDIIIDTPNELEEAKKFVVNIGKIAVNTGKLMYERVPTMV
jgi:predicted nucleotidyltransferase